jgi:hypothetical protein
MFVKSLKKTFVFTSFREIIKDDSFLFETVNKYFHLEIVALSYTTAVCAISAQVSSDFIMFMQQLPLNIRAKD